MTSLGTFGPTNEAITDALAAVGQAGRKSDPADDRDATVAAAWIRSQFEQQPTLLRPHYRQSANPRTSHYPTGILLTRGTL